MNAKNIEKDYKLAKEILSKIEIINKKDLTDFINQYLDEENCYKLDTVINILKADKQKETFFNSKKFFQELDKKNPKENLKYNNKNDTLQGSSVNIKILVLRDGNLIIINGTNSEENRWYDNDDLQDNDIFLGMEVYTETYNKKEMYPKGNLEIVKFETPVIFRKEYLKNKKEENMENTINYNDLINEEKLKELKVIAMINNQSIYEIQKTKISQTDLNSFIESVAEKTGIEIKNEDEVEIIDNMNNKQQKNRNLKLK